MEFDLMRQLLTVFHDNIEDMTVTQKRAAIRTVVRKVVWDGKVAHVVLFGSPEDEIDWTTFPVAPEEDDNDPDGGGGGSDSLSGVRSGEDSKCYPLPSALSDGKENPLILQSSVNASKWVFWAQEGCHLFLLQKVSCEVSCLTPLYILQVPLAGPHTTSEAQAFFHMYHSYSEITNPSDRMRWCRYRLGLLQKDVAAMVGMEEWLYQDLESGAFHRSFTPELADKLAALYGIPVEDILDD